MAPPAGAPRPRPVAHHGEPMHPHVGPTGDRDPDRSRRRTGLVLWILAVLGGIGLNVFFTFFEIAAAKNPDRVATAMIQGAIPAFAMLVFYLPIPAVLDRYDPEPWWSLAMAFVWGAFVATGVAGTFNSIVHVVVAGVAGEPAGRFVMTVFAAPFSEEIMKGLVILGFFHFLRREFDGVVDGILYASFCALGFAAVENVQYYTDAALVSQEKFTTVFVLRGIIAPWGHPLYTAMTGIGFGVARETENPFWRKAAPLVGLSAAMFLHALWNFVPNLGGAVFLVSLLFWFVFVFAFLIILIVLVRRKGKVIADHLRDELMIGNLTPYEFNIVTSAFGNLQTYVMPQGATWRRLIRASGRLALCKWHTARAMRGKKRTFSIEFIAPLREEMQTLRRELARR